MHIRQTKVGSFKVEFRVGIMHTECSSTQVEVGVEVRVPLRQTKVGSSPQVEVGWVYGTRNVVLHRWRLGLV